MEQRMKIAVCDDREDDRKRIIDFLQEYADKNELYPEIEEFTSGEEFLSTDISVYVLVFMDIFMDGINGMETAKKLLARNSRIQIVFQSTSTEFAVEAFDVEALHYMIKPVNKEKVFGILDRFMESISSLRTVRVKIGRMEEDVYLDDILYVEADGKKSNIHTKKGRISVSMPVAELAEILPKKEFCRPIRWALVSLKEVVAIPTDVLKLSDGTEIGISRMKRKEIQEAFADYSWRNTRRRMQRSRSGGKEDVAEATRR